MKLVVYVGILGLKNMLKKCKFEGCNGKIWGKEYCSMHYRMVFPPKSLKSSGFKPVLGAKMKKKGGSLKKGKSVLKRSKKAINKISEKQKLKNAEKSIKTKELHEFMYNWYLKQENKNCWACGSRLYGEFSTAWVDHLILKSKHPELAFEENNLYLCCLGCHSEKESGHPKKNHKEAIVNAREKYGK